MQAATEVDYRAANRCIGVAHGDIKPSNFLIEQHEGEINCLLIDFGSCVIRGQDRFPTWNPPWNPPELGGDFVSHTLGFERLSQADLYALGLLCVHILLSLDSLRNAGLCFLREGQSDEEWEMTISQLEGAKSLPDDKSPESGPGLLGPRILKLVSQAGVDEERKVLLESIVRGTICSPPGRRTMPWSEVVRLGRDQLSFRYDSSNPVSIA